MDEIVTFEYDADNGMAVPDGQVENFVREAIKNKISYLIKVSTENVIHAARALMVKEGIQVKFRYNNADIVPNKYGRINHWPEGFCDYADRWMNDILFYAMEKKVAERKKEEVAPVEDFNEVK